MFSSLFQPGNLDEDKRFAFSLWPRGLRGPDPDICSRFKE